MNEISEKKRAPWAAIAGVVAVVLLALWVRQRGGTPESAVPETVEVPEALVADETGEPGEFDLDAHLERVRNWDPETGFDYEAHEAAIKTLGPVHHQALLASAEAGQALREFEERTLRQTEERATVADALDDLRQRRDALLRQRRDAFAGDALWTELQAAVDQAELTVRETRIGMRESLNEPRKVAAEEIDTPEAEAARAAIEAGVLQLREASEALRERREALRGHEETLSREQPEAAAVTEALTEVERAIADHEETLAELFARDPDWRALQAQVEAAETEVTAARLRLQMAIRARMQVEHEIAYSPQDDRPATP